MLSRDVGPCGSDGILVAADGITINLNGHRIRGTAGPDDNVGIRIRRRTAVTVKGGEVTDFGAGVVIQGGSANIVTGVTVHDNVGPNSGDFGDGVAILNSPDNVVERSTVRHNGPYDGIGVFGTSSTGNRIVGNRVEDNNISQYFPQVDLTFTRTDGVNLGAGLGGASRTTIQGNVITGNGLNGIVACSRNGNPCLSTDNVIVHNLVQANGFGDPANPGAEGAIDGDGIHVAGIRPPGTDPSDFVVPTGDLVAENRVVGNAGNGISISNPGNRIIGNIALANGGSFTDFYGDLQDFSSAADDCSTNQWDENVYATAHPSCTTAGGHQIGSARLHPGRGQGDRPQDRRPTDDLLDRHQPAS